MEILFQEIVVLLREARTSVVRNINSVMVSTYFEIGKRIVKEEQKGKARAEYGKELIQNLSRHLTKEFGKGFSERNLEQMRKFYLSYPIPQTVSAELDPIETGNTPFSNLL